MFLRIVDHINCRTYPLDDVPATYGPLPSYFFEKNSAGPIHLPYEGETGRGRYTIAHMIEMYFNKLPFTIIETGDILDIEKHLGRYIDSFFEPGTVLGKEDKEYQRRAEALYEKIHTSACRIRSRFPDKKFKASPFLELVVKENKRL